MHVPFFKPYLTGKELRYLQDLLQNRRNLSGDGIYTKKAQHLLETRYGIPKVLLTTSGTTALELAVRLLSVHPGDEVILPSFTFSSTANAILLRQGLKPVFADICADTCNIDPESIRRVITRRTRAIIVVHYAGVACDMDAIMEIAAAYHLTVIEDAAQAIESTYKGRQLGTIGDFGCFSFHDTKNITCGEGGALCINTRNKEIWEKAEIIREKGTDRSRFFRGEIDKYTWQDIGSSILPSDILAAFLLAQLEHVEEIMEKRREKYAYYQEKIRRLHSPLFTLPQIPDHAKPNAHIFYLICQSPAIRDSLRQYLQDRGISASFHYQPLHAAPVGIRLGNNPHDLPVTNRISACLLRLPMYADISQKEQDHVIRTLRHAAVLLAPANAQQHRPNYANKPVSVSIGITVPSEGYDISSLIQTVMKQTQQGWELKEVFLLTDPHTRTTTASLRELAGSYTKVLSYTNRPALSVQLTDLTQRFRGDMLVIMPSHIRLSTKETLTRLIHPFSSDPSLMITGASPIPGKKITWFQKLFYYGRLFNQHVMAMWHAKNPAWYNPHNTLVLRRAFAKTVSFPAQKNVYQALAQAQKERGYAAKQVASARIQYDLPASFAEARNRYLQSTSPNGAFWTRPLLWVTRGERGPILKYVWVALLYITMLFDN